MVIHVRGTTNSDDGKAFFLDDLLDLAPMKTDLFAQHGTNVLILDGVSLLERRLPKTLQLPSVNHHLLSFI